MRHAFQKNLLATVVLSSLLVACGGGGGDGDDDMPSNPTAEGAYVGTLSGANDLNAFSAVITDTGEVWAFYGAKQASGLFAISGFLQGSGNSSDGNYTSTDLRDFGASPAMPATATARYDARAKTIDGKFNFDSFAVSFKGDGNTAPYKYDTPATLASVAGNWSLNALTGESITLSVAPNGSVTGVSSLGCTMTGTLTPRPSGKNVFNASLRFGPAPCALPDQSASGIALAYPLANGIQQFMFAGFDASRQHGTAAIGMR
ncbi:hypothetical protein [Pseudorhodoferax sp. Leaf267]|uniref:hypothetical protein n=1 Tax=Pseudorhodoferax sp. Leaf267 TaxID=1736316 RepID=UPI0006F51A35|nr:hypothetical protein [Pseudorhodoferax sp. Leaf267]KQP22993.1 hypothetical protein ASF43_03650 [Pseudorhodoferax sp. Leaf267]